MAWYVYSAKGVPLAKVYEEVTKDGLAEASVRRFRSLLYAPGDRPDLIEAATPTLQRDRKEATLRRWLDDMPDAVVQPRPVLAIAFVGALMSSNEFSDVDRRLPPGGRD